MNNHWEAVSTVPQIPLCIIRKGMKILGADGLEYTVLRHRKGGAHSHRYNIWVEREGVAKFKMTIPYRLAHDAQERLIVGYGV